WNSVGPAPLPKKVGNTYSTRHNDQPSATLLKNNFQGELQVARLPSADPRCVAGMQRTEDQPHPRTGSHRVVRAAQIDAVEQVKDFHPELRGHLLRHYRRSFENREIERREPRTVELVPGGVPE